MSAIAPKGEASKCREVARSLARAQETQHVRSIDVHCHQAPQGGRRVVELKEFGSGSIHGQCTPSSAG